MFKQTFQSDVIPYRKPGEGGIGAPILGGVRYHDELVTPPREYAEEIASATGLFFEEEISVTSSRVLVVFAMMNQIYWPSWSLMSWRFNADTGQFISRGGYAGSLYTENVAASNDGSLWETNRYPGNLNERSPRTYQVLQSIPASRFGLGSLNVPMVDKGRNLAIFSHHTSGAGISVYNLTTGQKLRSISTSGQPVAICQEDDTRCYVLSNGGFLNLIDYSTGQILSTTRSPILGADWNAGTGGVHITWDSRYRRLLAFEATAANEDGSSKDRIYGYYPVPLPMHLTNPIPLTPPRKYRTTPVLTRLVGDVGEPIGGVRIAATVTDDATLVGSTQVTDNAGFATLKVLGLDEGTTTVTTNAEVLT